MSETGKLLARTYVSDMVIPLGKANVTVLGKNDGGNSLIAFRTTDSNGKTEEIEIATPDFEESRNDSATGERFSTVDIIVEKEGYAVTLIRNVQVFAERLSEQDVEMVPLPEFAEYDDYYNVFTVTPQNL